MFKLEDGKLYEDLEGRRFRVTYNKSKDVFECPKAYNGFWSVHGYTPHSDTHLVKEVEENRWVPIHLEDIADGAIVRKTRGHHWQELVSRTEARRRAPNYNKVAKVAQIQHSNRVDIAGDKWFCWSSEVENNTTYLTIETSVGKCFTFVV
jgi:hypothetical protein